MYVCMCVCARPTLAITPKFGVGSSFYPGSAPSQGATPNGYPLLWPLPNGGVFFENWTGAKKQKLLLGVCLCVKIIFVGGSP